MLNLIINPHINKLKNIQNIAIIQPDNYKEGFISLLLFILSLLKILFHIG